MASHRNSVSRQGLKPLFFRSLNVAAEQFAEKLKTLSFRGTLRAEESLFSRVSNTERFLTSCGMTTIETFSANCLAAGVRKACSPRVTYFPRMYANISGATIDASDSMTNRGVAAS